MGCKGSLACLTPPDQADLCSPGTERNWLQPMGSRWSQQSSSSTTAPKSCFSRREAPCSAQLREEVSPADWEEQLSRLSARPHPPHPLSSLLLTLLHQPGPGCSQDSIKGPKWSSHGWHRDELMHLTVCKLIPQAGLWHSRCSQKSNTPQVLQCKPHRQPSARQGRRQVPSSLQTSPREILKTITSLCLRAFPSGYTILTELRKPGGQSSLYQPNSSPPSSSYPHYSGDQPRSFSKGLSVSPHPSSFSY